MLCCSSIELTQNQGDPQGVGAREETETGAITQKNRERGMVVHEMAPGAAKLGNQPRVNTLQAMSEDIVPWSGSKCGTLVNGRKEMEELGGPVWLR